MCFLLSTFSNAQGFCMLKIILTGTQKPFFFLKCAAFSVYSGYSGPSVIFGFTCASLGLSVSIRLCFFA